MRKVGDRCRKFSFGKSNHKNSNMKKQPKQAFTLIELLTVIAIIGILASILIPTVGRVRESARRTVDASNIRQIGQASLIYANDNRESLPPNNLDANGISSGTGNTTTIDRVAVALALGGGLNDAAMWVSQSDRGIGTHNATTVLDSPTKNPRPPHTDFTKLVSDHGLSFAYISGLKTASSSTTPVAFTRGLKRDGKWDTDGVYGTDGGHIVFLGGNVSFYKDLGTSAATGRLIKRTDSTRTNNIVDTIAPTNYIRAKGKGDSLNGTPGV